MSKYKIGLKLLFFFLFSQNICFAQEELAPIVVRSEIHKDKILIRWAASNPDIWQKLNNNGVILERFTISRNNQRLDPFERVLLSEQVLKPRMDEKLEKLIDIYPYGAIIAQAVFGENFDMSQVGQGGISSVIAKSNQLRQRFVFSLYAADMCFEVAKQMGWGFEDKTIVKAEKYLYVVTLQDEKKDTKGSVFANTAELTEFFPPLDFTANFLDSSVKLSLDYGILATLYNSYVFEKSTDGINFSPISDNPVTLLQYDKNSSLNELIYLDSIQNNQKYFYRALGITPFGTKGKYSEPVSGIAFADIKSSPYITSINPSENSVEIQWDFEVSDTTGLSCFSIEISENDRDYKTLYSKISPQTRKYKVSELNSSNYFVVVAESKAGTQKRSLSAFYQQNDTIAPSIPVELNGKIDSLGVVRISWQQNTEKDILGYRIYRSQNKEETPLPLNDIAIKENYFEDTISIKNLNARIYYAVASLDKRYNQSAISTLIEIKKPVKVKPSAPLITDIKSEENANKIFWVSGLEEFLSYFIIEKTSLESGKKDTIKISDLKLSSYLDTDIEDTKKYSYAMFSVSETGVNSDSSQSFPFTAKKSHQMSKIDFKLNPMQGKLKINIKHNFTSEASLKLYKKEPDKYFQSYKEISNNSNIEIFDTDITPGKKYEYMLEVSIKGQKPIVVIKSVNL